jgi:hypothetical protein
MKHIATIETSLLSLMSKPIPYDWEKLISGEERSVSEHLLSEYEKDGLNNLIAMNPDILILDFSVDINYGVIETACGSVLINDKTRYTENPSFEDIEIVRVLSPISDFDEYTKNWAYALDDFMQFLTDYLPETQVFISNLQRESDESTDNEIYNKVFSTLKNYASKHYNAPIITDIDKIAMDKMDFSVNNIYDWNLIRNADFNNNREFWQIFEEAPFKKIGDEMVLSVDKGSNRLYQMMSSSIEIAGTKDQPVILELIFDVYVEDVFSLDLFSDHIFIVRGFDHKLGIEHSQSTQQIYTQQAKFLNLTSSKWKTIKMELELTEPFVRIGLYAKLKKPGIVKWRNISLTHIKPDAIVTLKERRSFLDLFSV